MAFKAERMPNRLGLLIETTFEMIGLTFFLLDNQKHANKCEILLESYCDCTSSGRETKAVEQIVIAALKALRLEQTVYVVREGSLARLKAN
jgi:hypothetical protein